MSWGTIMPGNVLKGVGGTEIQVGEVTLPQGSQGRKPFFPSLDSRKNLNNLVQAVQSGKTLNPQELLLYQIRASQYGMRVEMISKVAEGVSATVRRLQNG